MNVIHTAAAQYANRPADERFGSLEDIIAAAALDKSQSRAKDTPLKDMRAVANGSVYLAGPKGTPAALTHYAFGQLSRLVDAPAGYLRTLPPALAAECINHGLQTSPAGADAQLLMRWKPVAEAEQGYEWTVRAVTGTGYSRLWDVDALTMVRDTLGSDARWQLPPTWKTDPATGQPLREGAYRGDRDSFVILCNGGSIVEDPTHATRGDGGSDGQNGAMYRALMISNSEVGHRSLTIETVLYRYICGNHMLWGAIMDRRFRRRHVGNITRAAAQEISRFAWNFTHASTERDTALLRTMATNEVAATRDGLVDALRGFGATIQQAESAYDLAERYEQNPRSYWGIANGLTRASQLTDYQDDRYQLDRLAADVLARAAKLVTV